MKTFLAMAAAVGALTLAAPASAQSHGGWQPINQRQAQLDHRIDVGVRNGALTRNEASRLRAEFNQIAHLEANYRRNGLSGAERADLDRRFDHLSRRIRVESAERNNRGDNWRPINQRQRELDARIDQGLFDGSLTRREAGRLRAEFQDIARLEARYRRNGLDSYERADLNRRFDLLSNRIYAQRHDWEQRRRRG